MASPETQSETTNPETQTQIQELSPEQISRLIELAQKENRIEARYILKLQRWRRQGQSYVDDADFKVIYGEAEEVTAEEWDEGYPYRRGEDVLIIPKTIPVIVDWWHNWDYDTDRGETETIYVFTSEGWKSVRVK